ncbi:Aste57867_450 [Aphanomyces stellatus]|uniref:Aste57867_450 protein n=1 Tax=Aphanomyces stellatus TaxID=120398 RepID=A0A485K307_9STRA|nr:hypothetical protein As57867_000449 [Aphanomyces stellatus]VFT77675.1 Aste57867_450 [Aphanomyces stellatus]
MAGVREEWEELHDAHVGAYYYNSKSGESRWTLPPEALDIHLPSNAIPSHNQWDQEPNLAVRGMESSGRDKDIERVVSRRNSLSSGEDTWGCRAGTLDEDHRGLNQFSTIADGSIFERPSSIEDIQQLRNWIFAQDPTICQGVEGKLKWPTFLASFEPPDDVDESFCVHIRSPVASAGLQQTKLVCSMDDTVFTVVTQAVRIYQLHLDGKHHPYVLKVTGLNEFMIDDAKRLVDFAFVSSALRNRTDIDLTLIVLTEKEMFLKYKTVAQHDATLAWDLDYAHGFPTTKLPNERDLASIQWPLRMKVHRLLHSLHDANTDAIVVAAVLYIGNNRLGASDQVIDGGGGIVDRANWLETSPRQWAKTICWEGSWLTYSRFPLASLPSTTRIGFTVYGISKQNATEMRTPLAVAQIPLADSQGRVLAGLQTVSLWPVKSIAEFQHGQFPIGFPATENPHMHGGVLEVEFDAFDMPLRAFHYACDGPSNQMGHQVDICDTKQNAVQNIAKKDLLCPLSGAEKVLLWSARSYCVHFANLLPKVLLAINWSSPIATQEIRSLLCHWHRFTTPRDALELLGHQFPDPCVRAWSVNVYVGTFNAASIQYRNSIHAMPDHEFAEYLLQLVQALKFETYTNSPLARLLLVRALLNPVVIGHRFFWLLKTEAVDPYHSERYSVILATYCSMNPGHRMLLFEQCRLLDQFEIIAQMVKKTPKDERLDCYRRELCNLNHSFTGPFYLSLSLKFECKSIIVDECLVMGSAKRPLWIAFENTDSRGAPICAIFKHGDDLRQDLVTLQMLRLFDRIWFASQLDLRLKPYGCQSIGFHVGMIEVIPHSKTTAHIHRDYGHTYFGAFMDTPIDTFLKQNLSDGHASYENAVDNFIRTCAGYCVATYVLGIGDRHSDNIMVARSGHLFHIDFGHFLGNFKSKFGVSRERSPFVLTPEMVYVMGLQSGPRFQRFEEQCCQAYNILRHHSHLFISLFSLVSLALLCIALTLHRWCPPKCLNWLYSTTSSI